MSPNCFFAVAETKAVEEATTGEVVRGLTALWLMQAHARVVGQVEGAVSMTCDPAGTLYLEPSTCLTWLATSLAHDCGE